MGAIGDLYVTVRAEVKEAVGGLKNVGDAAQGAAEKLRGAGDAVGNIEKKFIALGAAAAGAASWMAKAAIDQDSALTRLSFTIQNNGDAVNSNKQQLLEWNETAAQLAGVTTTEMIQAYTVLEMKTHSAEEAQRRLTFAGQAHLSTGESLIEWANRFGDALPFQIDQLEQTGVWQSQITSLDIEGAKASAIAAGSSLNYAAALSAVKSGSAALPSLLKRVDSGINEGEKSYEQAGLATAFAATSMLSYAEALAIVKYGGGAAINYMRRMGVETNSQAYSLNQLTQKTHILSAEQAERLRQQIAEHQPLVDIGNAWDALTIKIGGVFSPIVVRGLNLVTKIVLAFSKSFKTFADTATGPIMDKLKTVWLDVFGKQMPKPIQDILDFFTSGNGNSLWDRLSRFAKDIETVGLVQAIKNLFAGALPAIKTAISAIGTELDSMGPLGVAIKLAGIASVVSMTPASAALSMIQDAAVTAWAIVGITKALAGGFALPILIGLLLGLAIYSVAGPTIEAKLKSFLDDSGWWKTITGMGAIGLVAVGLAAGLSLPVTILLALAFAVASILFGEDIKSAVGGWFDKLGALVQTKIVELKQTIDMLTGVKSPAAPFTGATSMDVVNLFEQYIGRVPGAEEIYGRIGQPFDQVAKEIRESLEAAAHRASQPGFRPNWPGSERYPSLGYAPIVYTPPTAYTPPPVWYNGAQYANQAAAIQAQLSQYGSGYSDKSAWYMGTDTPISGSWADPSSPNYDAARVAAARASKMAGSIFAEPAERYNRYDIDAYGAGGIFSKPTLGIIGERGPEAVVPLSDTSRFFANARGQGGGGVTFASGAIVIKGNVDSPQRVVSLSLDLAREARLYGATH